MKKVLILKWQFHFCGLIHYKYKGGPMSAIKILFIVKKREGNMIWHNDDYGYTHPSSGLLNSVEMLSAMLTAAGVDNKVVEVVDNNSIDKEVHDYRPDIVIIEALWVVPEKFPILIKLHPRVKWIVRLHSNTPFLANEGIAFEWIFKYLQLSQMYVAANNSKIYQELKNLVPDQIHAKHILYLPNHYTITESTTTKTTDANNVVRIGCFGAIRPLKNQLIQAVAAIDFANDMGLTLKFYINATREELGGGSVLKNLRSLFANTPHQLVEVPWLSHANFLIYLKQNIDIGMQVSFTETFNIVTADYVSQDIPVVTSSEVEHVSSIFKTDTTDAEKIASKLKFVYFARFSNAHSVNKYLLTKNNKAAQKVWFKILDSFEQSMQF